MSASTNLTGHQAGTLQGVLLLLPVTMAVMGLVVLVPVLPGMMQQFSYVPGFQNLVPLLVLTLPAACVAILSPVAGTIVDFFGRRRTLIVGLVIYAIIGVLPIFLDSLSAIVLSRVVLGATESAIITASTTLIGDYFHGPDRERWLANQTAVASISAIILAFAGGALGNIFGWRGPFAAYGVSLLFALGLLLWTWEPQKNEQPSSEVAGTSARVPWNTILPISLLAVFGGAMFFMMQIQVSTALNDYYSITSPAQLGIYTGIASIAVAVGTLLYRRVVRLRVATQLLIPFVLLGVSYVMFNHSPQVNSFTGWLIVNQLGCGMLLPAMVVWAMSRLPFEVRGRGTGLFMMGWWLGQPLSTVLAQGVRGAMSNNLLAALQLFGILCLVAAAISLVNSLRGRPAGQSPA
jgi:MFS family permease